MPRPLLSLILWICLLLLIPAKLVAHAGPAGQVPIDTAPTTAAQSPQVVRTLAGLAALSPGDEVLVPGTISPSNPTTRFVVLLEGSNERAFYDLALYEVQPYGSEPGAAYPPSASPPFTLDLPDGSLRIVNDRYWINPTEGWRSVENAEYFVRGLDSTRPVTVIGTIVMVDGSYGIQADVVTGSSPEEMLNRQPDPAIQSLQRAAAVLQVALCLSPIAVSVLLGWLFSLWRRRP